jgi:hypothetical protein
MIPTVAIVELQMLLVRRALLYGQPIYNTELWRPHEYQAEYVKVTNSQNE